MGTTAKQSKEVEVLTIREECLPKYNRDDYQCRDVNGHVIEKVQSKILTGSILRPSPDGYESDGTRIRLDAQYTQSDFFRKCAKKGLTGESECCIL